MPEMCNHPKIPAAASEEVLPRRLHVTSSPVVVLLYIREPVTSEQDKVGHKRTKKGRTNPGGSCGQLIT